MADFQIIRRELLNEPPEPMRASMDTAALEDLAFSMKAVGLLEPLLVKEVPVEGAGEAATAAAGGAEGVTSQLTRYEIIDGHRRYLASAMAGIFELKCMVYAAQEETSYAMMHAANMCREDLTAAEEGIWFLQLAEKHNWPVEQICRVFRRSENYINERVRLVQVDAKVTEAVAGRRITFAVAKELLKCPDEAHRQYLLSLACDHGTTAKTVAYQVAQWKADQAVAQGTLPAHHHPEATLSEAPALPRCIFCNRDDDQQNIRTVEVHWYHKNDLIRLLEQLGVKAPAAS